ncbi:DNA polymerase I [Succinivibrio dextrinosolvens]|uniref:DNA polymerase I n=1 Tax=Succinivibrio dextrinosolvens TaxID=83771 RepID=UPI0024201BCC|nr:DNA polymerase I [Succinivibrio dextrinosolvens]MBE6423215.1 DNA polymerase I [Succinivibrio dextrinosolvens]
MEKVKTENKKNGDEFLTFSDTPIRTNSMTDNLPLVLVDGSSFLYRAFYAAPKSFTNSKGIPTGVCMILSRMLGGLTSKFSGAKFIVVFDAKGKSFRNEMYPEYKANRPPMPDELRVQIEYVHKIVRAMGFPLVSIEGVEADDVLGTYATDASKSGVKTVICTGDKDLAQLVDDNVILYDSMKDVYTDAKGVVEKFGVKPEHIIDFLALKGDSSDNIPGMAGVGDKTAVTLINELGGIKDIYNNLDKIASLSFRGSKTFAEKYREAFETVELSYRLATIRTDLELPLKISEVTSPVLNKDELIEIYTDLEFTKLLADLKKDAPVQTAKTQIQSFDFAKAASKAEDTPSFTSAPADYKTNGSKYILVTDENVLDELCHKILSSRIVALDTETTSLMPQEASLVGMSLSVAANEGYYIPLNHTYLGVPQCLSFDKVREKLLPVLNSTDVKIIGHNIKFDLLVLHYQNFEIEKVYADTMVMAHLLDSASAMNMDDLALRYLNYRTITYKEITGDKKKIPISEVPVEIVCNYAAEDADVTFRLYQILSEKLFASENNRKLFFEQEMPFLKVLYHMELEGVYVSQKELEAQNRNLKTELVEIQKQIYVSSGQEFNIASPKQLGKVLFEDLKIPYPKKVKDGKYSTAEDILEQIAFNYDIANLVLRYRGLSKLISTYTEKLQTLISPKTSRIYTSFNQTGTVTGRLSSSDPNLQNIPARTEEGKMIRKAFIAPEGYKIIAADYSQIELRLIAHISEDPNLRKAFLAGHDIHRATAAEVLGKSIDEVTPQERSHAKATNFGLMYGMGAFGLTRQTHMSMAEAKVYIQRYFERYPSVQKYMEETKAYAHEHGYVTSINGRHISVANINSSNTMLAKAAERAAINAPMQGSAADVIKKAMIRLDEWIAALPKNTIRMTVQVHDELIFEVKDEFVDEACAKISEIMENAYKLSVPLTVGVGVSSSWADAH